MPRLILLLVPVLIVMSGCALFSIPTPPPTPIPPEPPTMWVPSSVVYSPASTPTPRSTRTPSLMPTPVPPWTPWEMGVPTSTPRPTATPMPTATPQSTAIAYARCHTIAESMVHSFYRREVERAQIRGIPYPAFMDTCVSAASKLGIEGAVGCHTLANINGVSYGYVFDLCVSATSNESVDARLELDAVITCHAHATAIKGIPFDDYIFTACISAASELGIEAADKCHQLTLLQDSIPHRDIFGACLGGVRAGIPIDDVVEQISGVDFSIDLNRLSAALRGDDDGNSEQSSSLSGNGHANGNWRGRHVRLHRQYGASNHMRT